MRYARPARVPIRSGLQLAESVEAGLKSRGYLAEGMPADVIVYDPDTVDSSPPERVWDYPAGEWRLIQKAKGYSHIMVNGRVTFIDGMCTKATPGRLLRHGMA
jgi:N-acyl-D-amino-acid deacylase